jgi:hypothetical protein
MAQRLDDSELVTFQELLMANSIEVDSVTNLCIQLGIFTKLIPAPLMKSLMT